MSPRSTAPVPAGAFMPSALGATAQAQVNLLPPEIRSSRALGRAKVGMAFALLAVVVAAAVGYVFASLSLAEASGELVVAEAEAQRLTSEQAQYSEVPLVKGLIQSVQEARALGMSTEVLWPDYLRSVQAVTPEGVSIELISTEMPNPLSAATVSADPLDAPSVGVIYFTARARTLPDLAAWMDALDGVRGFADPTYSTAEYLGEDGLTYYQIAVSVQVDESAYASRFVVAEED